MKKKLFTVFVIISMLLLTCGILNASAATYGDLTYSVLSGKVTIKDCNTSASGHLTIPSTIDGYPVTSIGNSAFYDCSRLTSVEIPDSVTSIGSGAFYNCSSMTSVNIPGNVTSIGSSAFYNCSSLTSVEIPDSVKSIGSSAFYKCSKLASIMVDMNNIYYSSQDGVLFNGNKTELIQYPEGKTSTSYIIPDGVINIGSSAFYNCSGLTNVTIPDSVTSIGDYAFSECSKLMSITIGNGVKSIGSSAFYKCSSLTSVEIPDSVTSIGDYAFEYCSGLTSVTMPDSVTKIGRLAFYSCDSLTSVYITDIKAYLNCTYSSSYSNPVYCAGKLYLNNKRVINLTIPDGVTQIPDYAFYGVDSLQSITIPDSVTSIGLSAFYKCSGLTSVTIPDSVTSIGSSAFSSCSGMASVTIGNGVTTIDDYAFSSCSSLTNIEIPNSVTSIDNYAFYNCDGLVSVEIPDSVKNIGSSVFHDCDGLISVDISDSVTSIGEKAFYNCSSLTSVTIGNGVTSIGTSVFSSCSSLTNVYITDIGAWCNINFYAYSSNPLYYANNLYVNGVLTKEVVIPDSVTNIDNYAFYDCDVLTSVVLGNGLEKIPSECFYSCSRLKKVAIGENVSSIGANAFKLCSALETVVIPENVTEIEAGTFSGCNSIKTIEYAGSDEAWREVYIGSDNGTLTAATVNYGVTLPIIISYNPNGGTGTFSEQKVEEGGSITISEAVPTREGYKFLGWSTVSDGKVAEYQPSGILTVGEDNITLYAVWRKVVNLSSDVINNQFLVYPDGAPDGSKIIFVCYKNKVPVYMDIFTYQGSKIVPFATSAEYDEVKVMVWENLTDMTPLCEPNYVSIN